VEVLSEEDKAAEEEEEDVIASAAQGWYDLSHPDPPSYHQQLLDNLIRVRARMKMVQRHILAMKADQWTLGVWQVKLEEIQMKVDFGHWTPEEGLVEMKKLPELKPSDLKKKPYKLSYEQ